jgi:hypothetical protein
MSQEHKLDRGTLRIPAINQDQVIECNYSDIGERFFSPLKGEQVSGLNALHVINNDIILVQFGSAKAAAVIAKPNTFIAIEARSDDPSKRSALAFKENISHTNLNLALSVLSGEDVTYQDNTPVPSDVIQISDEDEFVSIALRHSRPLQSMKPTWYTEDWMTLEFEDYDSIVIRAEGSGIKAGVLFTTDGISVLNMEGNRLDSELFGQTLPATPLFSRLESNS